MKGNLFQSSNHKPLVMEMNNNTWGRTGNCSVFKVFLSFFFLFSSFAPLLYNCLMEREKCVQLCQGFDLLLCISMVFRCWKLFLSFSNATPPAHSVQLRAGWISLDDGKD